MESPAKKRQDRISRLPDELIHKVLSSVDAKVAVQTSVLSKRWKLVWTTLPFLNIGNYENSSPQDTYKFIRHVLSNRNHQSHVSELNLCANKCMPPDSLLQNFVEYAIEHNVENLSVQLEVNHHPYKLSTFNSHSLKELTLNLILEEFSLKSECWDLPALTYLCLVRPLLEPPDSSHHKLPGPCLTCLPSLRTLCLHSWDMSKSCFSFSLPDLTTLRLFRCKKLREDIWNFPALLSLELDEVDFPTNICDIFPTLVNLQNLTIYLTKSFMERRHPINCPQLLNLIIKIGYYASHSGHIKVLAPKLCNFTSFGILSTTFKTPELENVNIKLRGWFGNKSWIYRKKCYRQFTDMLSALGNAKNLTFDSDCIEALSATDFLAILPSPFYNLKTVKLPLGYKESSIYGALRSYILGGSPRATIVTTLLKSNQTAAASMTAQNVVLQTPVEYPTKGIDYSQYIDKTLTADTVNMNVREEHVVGDFVVDTDEVGHINVPVEEISKYRVKRDFGLWQGHEVNFEFVCLLDSIMDKYPETFEHFTAKNKKSCTRNLNMLCTSLNDLKKLSMTEIDSEIIVEYRDLFAYLQNRGFNVSWVVSRLNYIEHLRFSKPLIPDLHEINCRIDEDKSKLQELQARAEDVKIKLQDLEARVYDAKIRLQNLKTLRLEKLTEIEKAFGTMGTNFAVGFIGDDLLPSP